MIDDFGKLIKLVGSLEQMAIDCGVGWSTCDKWMRRVGIPQKHWEVFIKKYDLTPAELFSINQKIAKKNK